MKLYNWIDHLFSTPAKRRKALSLAVSVYWFYQFIWQFLFFYSLFQVYDYNSLFAFMNTMATYQNALVVKIAYAYISYGDIVNVIDVLDVLMIVLTFIWFLGADKKQRWIYGLLGIALCILIGICLIVGIHSDSISYLIGILRILSAGGMIFSFCLWAYLTIQSIVTIIKTFLLKKC